MTASQDLFVGILAVVVGGLLVVGAAVQSRTLMQLTKSRMLIESFGLSGARWVIAGFGLFSIVLGVLIASGWRIRW